MTIRGWFWSIWRFCHLKNICQGMIGVLECITRPINGYGRRTKARPCITFNDNLTIRIVCKPLSAITLLRTFKNLQISDIPFTHEFLVPLQVPDVAQQTRHSWPLPDRREWSGKDKPVGTVLSCVNRMIEKKNVGKDRWGKD